MEFPSKLIENAVGELARLPGIGRKTALRLALHLLKAEMDTRLRWPKPWPKCALK